MRLPILPFHGSQDVINTNKFLGSAETIMPNNTRIYRIQKSSVRDANRKCGRFNFEEDRL